MLVSLCTSIAVHNTARDRQFYLYSPSSRPTSHLRCHQLEVREWCPPVNIGFRSHSRTQWRMTLYCLLCTTEH